MAGSMCGKTGADDVYVRPLSNLEQSLRNEYTQQLIGLLAAGCHEEQLCADEDSTLIELGCRDLQEDLLSGAPGWYVAWYGRKPVGIVRLATAGSSTPDAAVLAGLYVAPEWRKQGVGRRLVHAAVAGAQEWGLKRVFIYVAKKSPARNFYHRLGLGQGVQASMPGFLRLDWNIRAEKHIASQAGREALPMGEKKSIPFMLKAIAVAMGVASVVLSILQPSQVERMTMLLGIGLAALAISTLND